MAANSGKAALVSWTVVTSILFVVSTIFAIYSYVDAGKVREESEKKLTKFKNIIAEAEITSTDIEDVKKLAGTEGFPAGSSVVDILKEQRSQLAKKIAGKGATYETAIKGADAVVADIGAKAKDAGLVAPPADGALQAVTDALLKELTSRQASLSKAKADLAASAAQQKELAASVESIRTDLNKQIEEARAQATSSGESANKTLASKDEQIKAIQEDFDKKVASIQETINQQQISIAEQSKAVAQLTKEKEALQNRLSDKRLPVDTGVSRAADGSIVRVPGNNLVYIDLGQGEQIAPGLTFQIYDRVEGVPTIGDVGNEDNLPRGKGSIEVLRVGATTSECRIVKTQPGQTIAEGDLIVNVVYDRNIKYNFLVYGKFDLDQNGTPTDNDTDVIKRLVGQWGAKMADKIDVDTDFVVLGKEPVIPNYSKEESDDPINKARIDNAREELAKYQEVVNQAKALHIPVLNQNRFLYFIGYYELAKR